MRKKKILIDGDIQNIIGEHLYFAISYFKKSGFKNIRTTEIKDINCTGNNYSFEVKTVSINGISKLVKGEPFPENANIVITYD